MSKKTIEAVYKLQDQMSKELKRITKEMDRFQKEAKSNDKAIKKNETSLKGLAKGVGAFAVAIGAVKLFEFGNELARVGASAELVSKSFAKMANDDGRNAVKTLNDLRTASKGFVDDMTLQQSALKASIAGINMDDLTVAMQYVSNYALATGKNIKQAMETTMTGLARGSAQFMDDIGIMVMGSKDVVGDSIKQMKEKMGAFADVSDTAGARTKRLTAEMESLKQEIGQGLVPAQAEMLQLQRDLFGFLAKHTDDISLFTREIVDYAKFIGDHKTELGLTVVIGGIVALIPKIKALGVAVSENPLGVIALSAVALAEGVNMYSDALDRATDNKIAQSMWHDTEENIKSVAKELKTYTELQQKLTKNPTLAYSEGWNKQLAKSSKVLEDITGQMPELNKALGVYTIAGASVKSLNAELKKTQDEQDRIKKQAEDAKKLVEYKKKQAELMAKQAEEASMRGQQHDIDLQKQADNASKRGQQRDKDMQKRADKRKEQSDKELEYIIAEFEAWNEAEQNKKKKLEENAQAEKDARLQNIDDMSNYANTIGNIVGDILNNKMNLIDKEEKRQIQNVKTSTKSEEEKAKAISKIEKKAEADKKEIAIKEWRNNLIMSIANTALGVTKTMATMGYPIGIPFAAAVAATGAVSTGIIASNKPKFQDGGIVGGNSYTGDNIDARVNSGEMILNREQQAKLFSMVNSGGGGGATHNITINTVSSEGVEDAVLSALYSAQENNKVDTTRLSIGVV